MTDPTFNECWFDVAAQATVAELVRSVDAVDGLIIEIGAWEGRSTIAIADAAWPRVVQTVDTWAGADSDDSGHIAAGRDVKSIWQANVQAATRGNVVAHHMDWREYVPTITDPVAFCFIDGEHTYDEVFDNINAVVPLLASGAVLCGDDIRHSPVSAACSHALGGFREHGVMWSWVKP